MLTIGPKVWTQQPQGPSLAQEGIDVAVNAAVPSKNLVPGGALFSNANPIVFGQYGKAISFDRASATPINTGYVPGTITAHSAILLVRHRLLQTANQETYLTNRVSANNGFLFWTTSAAGSAPRSNIHYWHYARRCCELH
jgi:hypothetical protein